MKRPTKEMVDAVPVPMTDLERFQKRAERAEMALAEIEEIATNHLDYDTPGWHQVARMAEDALKRNEKT